MNKISRQLFKIASELNKVQQIKRNFEELSKSVKKASFKKILQYLIRQQENDAKELAIKYLINKEDYDKIKDQIERNIISKINGDKIKEYQGNNELLQKFLDKNTSVTDYIFQLFEHFNQNAGKNQQNIKFYNYWTSGKNKIYIQTNAPNELKRMSIFEQLKGKAVSMDERIDRQKGISVYTFDFGNNTMNHKSSFGEMKSKLERESKLVVKSEFQENN